MGNRAIIIPRKAYDSKKIIAGLYVHWYDENELKMWLQRMNDEGYRSFRSDPTYALARLCQIACEEYIDGLNIGITAVDCNEDISTYKLDVGFVLVDGYEIVDIISGDE